MAVEIHRYEQSEEKEYLFSILIPTWNNLPYLQKCLNSLNSRSAHRHQIILFVNEGSDGTLGWLEKHAPKNVDYIHSPENVGICFGVNLARSLARADYLVYMNDDMVVLPGWDEALMAEIGRFETDRFMLSSTMIEPLPSGNPAVIVKDYGTRLEEFREKELLDNYPALSGPNWQGSTWPPVVIHRDLWDLVGGFSIEFSPGMYSDPDLSFKLLRAGVRHFMGVGTSLVYHFGSKSTGRIRKNKGHRMFLMKWGISARTLRRDLLKMGTPWSGPLTDPLPDLSGRVTNRLKRLWNAWSHRSG